MVSTIEPGVVTNEGRDTDYQRVEAALRYLVDHAEEQPSLGELAGIVGLSEFHFQRVFSRWAGVSPKRFLQFVTLNEAKARLAANANVLDATLDVGLSGPARLHDLFVTYEAVTPGAVRTQGEGLMIDYGFAPSPFGEVAILATDRGICGLGFVGPAGREAAFDELARPWSRATFVRDDAVAAHLAGLAFDPLARSAAPLGVVLRGSPFQLKVWEALLRVPEGAVVDYGHVASAVGVGAGGARAVGSAVGENPVAFLIPCHRVIRSTGALGGYRWGEARKLALLGRERARTAL